MTKYFVIVAFCLVCVIGCRYAKHVHPTNDIVEYILIGDAENASSLCDYPLIVNLGPISPKIRNRREFVKWFPILFDANCRKKYQKKKIRDGGWCFHNWQGEMFGRGELWRDYYTKKLQTINLISESLFHWWEKEYAQDLSTLFPKNRNGCAWPAVYFTSDDGKYFGRMDSLGEHWTTRDGVDTSAGCRVSSKFRIMLFKKHQNTFDDPYKTFYYDAKDDKRYGSRFFDDIVSEKNDFSFCVSQTTQIPTDMVLVFGTQSGHETRLGLNFSDWPPRKNVVK